MKIDLYTIHVFLLCLAGAFSIAWFVLWRTYPHVRGIMWWAFSVAVLTLGGIFVVRNYVQGGYAFLVIGHLLVAFGFTLMWVGARRFYGLDAPWLGVALINAVGCAALLAAGEHVVLLNLVYSVSAAVPFALVVRTLLPHVSSSLAARLAAAALVVAIVGEILRFLTVAAYASDTIPATLTRPVALFGVLAIAFGWTVCMFGFVLCLMERVRAELSALVAVDELTGLASRRHFQDRLVQERARAHRTGRPFCLLVLDFDGFKAINDAYGHAAGDLCLRRFGEIASARLRRSDLIARIGGDEFGIIMPETRLEEALHAAEGLREALRAQTVSWKDRQIVLAASIGVTEWNPARGQSIEDLVSDADRALYRAKEDGRDRVAAFPAALSLAP
ncbi:GGDEF domain-containing protein [Aquabacter sp. CN5-332]|uniref:GGDEF domain-containing protein n=1 Tax=Aquabacter sp. CN5-332 TaxID=3156608 RepID=UPI0032B5401F